MRKILGIFMVSLLAVACSSAQESSATSGENTEQSGGGIVDLVPAAKFKELMKNQDAQIVDVRTPEEFAGGKIGDAQNINFFDADFKTQIDALDKDKPVLIYCAAGSRSAKAVSIMKGMGFSEIHELQGGYRSWR